MSIPPQMKLVATALVSVLALFGCSDASVTAGGGCGGTGCPVPSSGSITNFGSIYVNGVRYDTTSATFTHNGQPVTESQLERGMVVSVLPESVVVGSNAVAASVDYASILTGLVEANSVTVTVDPLRCLATGGAITAIGQAVQVNEETLFINAIDPLVDSVGATVSCYDGIGIDDRIEVSGFSDGHGSIFATMVRLLERGAATTSSVELSGVVSLFDEPNMLFNIGTQSIDYSAATQVPAALADGLYVRVNGTMDAGVLRADSLLQEGDGDIGIEGNEDNEAELYGVVTQPYSSGYFTLNGQRVQVTVDTELGEDEDDGIALGVADLVAGTRVMVDGHLVDNLLVADELEFHAQASVELQGTVQALNPLTTTLSVAGQSVTLNASTLMIDESAGSDHIFAFSEIVVGDSVSVDAYNSIATGGLVATRLERY